jgi:ABC-2 type transport system ATP-binding protein
MTILLTTHYLDEAEQLCDRVAIMHDGRIVALDSPAALLAGMGDELLELRVSGDVRAELALLRRHGIAQDDAYTVGASLHVPLHDRHGRQAIAMIADLGLATTAIATRSPTLDDVYLQHTGVSLAA